MSRFYGGSTLRYDGIPELLHLGALSVQLSEGSLKFY